MKLWMVGKKHWKVRASCTSHSMAMHHFASAVHVVPNVEILLPDTEIPIIKRQWNSHRTAEGTSARYNIIFSFEVIDC